MRKSRKLGLLAAALAVASAPVSAKESRSWAVYWFSQANYSTDGDCGPGGINPPVAEQFAHNLRDMGYTGAQVEALMKKDSGDGEERGWDQNSVRGIMNSRARIDGKPVNAYAHPAAAIDPHIKTVTGKFAYGFNLDGRGAEDPKAFEDPDTHEKGVDNQLFRAMGCTDSYRGSLEHGNGFWAFMWMAEKDSSAAWLITVEGENLDQDGPVTIRLARAMETPKFNADGSARADMTFRRDPETDTEGNIYKGVIKNRVVSITEPGKLHIKQDQLTFPEFDLNNFHARMTIEADGQLNALLGGYQSVEQAYFALGEGGLSHESNSTPELVGTYYNIMRLADADPDPKTGKNWSISATYHVRAVPAFVVEPKAGPPKIANK